MYLNGVSGSVPESEGDKKRLSPLKMYCDIFRIAEPVGIGTLQ